MSVQHRRALGQRLVVGDRDLEVGDVAQLLEIAAGLLDQLGILGVQVRDEPVPEGVALHRHAEPVALVVEEADLPAVRGGLPEDVPGDVHGGDVLADQVVAPADSVRPDDVRHRVAGAAVVERVGELGPDVRREVRQIGVVQRLQELQRHQVDDVRARETEDDVVGDGARLKLRDPLIGRVYVASSTAQS